MKRSIAWLISASLTTVGVSVAVGAPGEAEAQGTRAPASPGELTITARDQPIAGFIRDLFGRVGRPVVPSANLTGTINGVFRGSVNKIFADIAKAFNLISYDDGAALYVYTANELRVQTLTIGDGAAQRVVRQLNSQRLTDRRNFARAASDGTLVISGTPRFVEQASALARSDDGGSVADRGGGGGGGGYGGVQARPEPEIQPLEFRVFYLRYARAEDAVSFAGGREVRLPGLATILQNLVLDQRPGGSALGPTSAGPTLGARLVRQSQPRLGGTGLNAVPPDLAQTPLLGIPDSGGEVLGFDGASGDVAVPLTQDVVRIEPNPYLNAIIVRDVPERMAAYDSLIRALDVEPQIVEVQATIIDINVDKARRLGINYRFGSGGFGFLLGDGSENDLRLQRFPGVSRRDNTTNITPAAEGGTISTIIGSQREFLGRVQALERRGVARVVSRPQIMTLSNVEAVFDRTRTFYVRVAGDEQVDLFNVTSGTVLRVNPHVFRDQDQTRVRMIVNIEDGSISPSSVVDNIPIVDRASVNTQAMVLDGESLLLGGMTVDADSDDVSQIPLLGDIPVLGNLFKTRTKNRQRTERLFLITPRLVTLGGSRALPASAETTAPVATPGRPAPVPVPPSQGDTPADRR